MSKYNPEHQRQWREANAERMRELRRESYARNPETARFYNLKRWYGVTREQYDDMHLQQNAKCAICGIAFSELSKRPSVDHDHATGKVRALLCTTCNVRVGYVEGEASWRPAVLQYLSQHTS